MKQTVLAIVFLFACANLNAQGDKCFDKGDVLLNFGTSWGWFGSSWGWNNGTFFTPNIFFSADIGVHEYVSVGPYVGAAFQKRNSTKFRGIGIGARGNFHWWQLLDDKVSKDLKQDQLEMYLTLYLGGQISGVKTNNAKSSTGSFDGGSSLGFRYYPRANGRVAVFTEWGRTPMGWGLAGAILRI